LKKKGGRGTRKRGQAHLPDPYSPPPAVLALPFRAPQFRSNGTIEAGMNRLTGPIDFPIYPSIYPRVFTQTYPCRKPLPFLALEVRGTGFEPVTSTV
jgi:hypothetical protein